MFVKAFKRVGLMGLLGWAFVASSCGGDRGAPSHAKEMWNSLNDPSNFGVPSRQINSIPTSAQIADDRFPWSGDFWATRRGGISYRWQSGAEGSNYQNYLYRFPSASRIGSMTSKELNALSPAEKFDIALGRYDLPLARSERDKTLRSVQGNNVPGWFGLCHGWAAASHMAPAPSAIRRVTLPSGATMRIFDADQKALWTYLFANGESVSRGIGGRCDRRTFALDALGRPIAPECRDTNPASLHLVLAEYIGRRQQVFSMDKDVASEVWNQPVVGYAFSYSNHRSWTYADAMWQVRAPGTVALIDVRATIRYLVETYPAYEPHDAVTREMTVSYTLELNQDGYIIGGEWTSGQRPDFLWTTESVPASSDDGLVRADDIRWLTGSSVSNPVPPPAPTPTPSPTPTPTPTTPPAPAPGTGCLTTSELIQKVECDVGTSPLTSDQCAALKARREKFGTCEN